MRLHVCIDVIILITSIYFIAISGLPAHCQFGRFILLAQKKLLSFRTEISAAKLIVESSLKNYRIEPSQGTHFFQNLTSFGVGYFTIDTASATSTGIYDVEFLNSRPAVLETEFVRVVKFDNPLVIGINGLKGTGVVVKPDK